MTENSKRARRLTAVIAVVATTIFILLQTGIIQTETVFETTSIPERATTVENKNTRKHPEAETVSDTEPKPLPIDTQTIAVKNDSPRTYLETRAVYEIDVSRLSMISPPEFYDSSIVYLSDNDSIYYYEEGRNKVPGPTRKITNIDSKTFAIVGTSYIKDKNGVYWLGWNEDTLTFEILRDVDTTTFSHVALNIYRDSHYIYVNNAKVPDINPDSFNLLGWRYFSNINGIYFFSEGTFTKLLDVDVNSFEVLEMFFAKDANHVYLDGKILPDKDSKTFMSPKLPPCTEC